MYLIIIKINNLQYVILGKISIIVSFLTLDKLRNYIIIDNPKFKPFITYILWFLLFKEDRSESRCTQTSMRLTKHGNFDLILIIVMENNDCKEKKRSIPSKFCSRNQRRIKKCYAASLKKGFYIKWKVSLHMHWEKWIWKIGFNNIWILYILYYQITQFFI